MKRLGTSKTVRLFVPLTEVQRDKFRALTSGPYGNKQNMSQVARKLIEDYINAAEDELNKPGATA